MRKVDLKLGNGIWARKNKIKPNLAIKIENMKFGEAIDLLDTPIDGKDYGQKSALRWVSNVRIIKGKFGLYQCTRDWPQPYSPSKDDLEAVD